MHRIRALLARLIPAAVATAGFAAIAHAALVAVAARSIGMELMYIAGLSFVVALVVALIHAMKRRRRAMPNSPP